MRILDFNHCNVENCRHHPNCGWNIQLGGEKEEELILLKQILHGLIEEDLTDYGSKMATEPFETEPR